MPGESSAGQRPAQPFPDQGRATPPLPGGSCEALRGRPSPLLPALPDTRRPQLPAQGTWELGGSAQGTLGLIAGLRRQLPQSPAPPSPAPGPAHPGGARGFRPWGRKTRGVGTKDSPPPGARGCVPAAVVACRRVAAPGCHTAMAQGGNRARRSPLTRSDPGEGSLTSPDPRRLQVPRRRQRPTPRLLLLPPRPARLPGCPRGPPCGGGGRPPGCCCLSGSATSPQAAIAKPQGPPSPPGPAAGGSINNPRPFILGPRFGVSPAAP